MATVAGATRASPRAPKAGPASRAAGGGLAARLPEPALLKVEWPDKRMEVRLARLDPATGSLKLRAVNSRDISPSQAAELAVPLAELQGIAVRGPAMKLTGPDGKELFTLYLEEGPEQVKVWLQGIRELLQLGSSRGPGKAAESAPSSPSALRSRIKAQEKRAEELEALNARKEEQLLKMHDRLEEALTILQAGQAMYAEQQRLVDSQQAAIAQLRQQLLAKVQPAKSAPAPAPAAPEQEEDLEEEEEEEEEEEQDEAIVGLVQRAQELQTQLMQLSSAASAERTSPSSRPSPTAQQAQQVSEAGAEVTNAQELLGHLQALIAEKDRLEEELRSEQAELEQQLAMLHAGMRAAGAQNGS